MPDEAISVDDSHGSATRVRGSQSLTAPATEIDSRIASVGSRRQVRFSLETAISEALPRQSPVGLARLRASADWATPGLGRHGVCELQRETRTLPTFCFCLESLALMWSPKKSAVASDWAGLVAPVCCQTQNLFKRKRASSCARRIRRTSTSTPHLIGAV